MTALKQEMHAFNGACFQPGISSKVFLSLSWICTLICYSTNSQRLAMRAYQAFHKD